MCIRDRCFTCPQPQYCQGGTTCTGNREGLACMKCKTNYYTIDGNDCIPCPESSIGQWSIAIGIILVCIFLIYKTMDVKDGFDEDEEEEEPRRRRRNHAKNAKKHNHVKRKISRGSFQEGIEKSVKRSNHIQFTLQTGFSILAKHTLYFSFTIPLMPLIHLPPELRRMIQSFLSLLTFDLSNFVSSPECEWDAPIDVQYTIKMILRLVFVLSFLAWYAMGKRCTKNKRSLKNKIIGVGMFLWLSLIHI